MFFSNKMFRFLTIIAMVACIVIKNGCAQAAGMEGQRLWDEANCLLDIEHVVIEKMLDDYSKKSGAEIGVVILNQNKTGEELTNKLKEKRMLLSNKNKTVYLLGLKKQKSGSTLSIPNKLSLETFAYIREPVKIKLIRRKYVNAVLAFAERVVEVEHYYKEHGNSMPVMDLETQAAQGNPFAQCFLAEKYYYGVMTEKNIELAGEFAKKSAEQGYAAGQALYASYLLKNKQSTSGFEWAKISAEQGNANGQSLVARCYIYGIGVEKNGALGYKYAQMAALQANSQGMGLMALCHFAGIGTSRDGNKAFWWASRAAKRKVAIGYYILSKLYEGNLGVEKDIEKRVLFLRKAADAGLKIAKDELSKVPSEKDLQRGWSNPRKDGLVEWTCLCGKSILLPENEVPALQMGCPIIQAGFDPPGRHVFSRNVYYHIKKSS